MESNEQDKLTNKKRLIGTENRLTAVKGKGCWGTQLKR